MIMYPIYAFNPPNVDQDDTKMRFRQPQEA